MAIKGKSTPSGCDMTEEEFDRMKAIQAGRHPDTGKPLCPDDEKTLKANTEKIAVLWFQFWGKGELCDLEAHFARDGNPFHAWKALKFAHRHGFERPDWVETYLVDGADHIVKIRDEAIGGKPVGREAERVGKALGFAHARGKTGWFKQAAMLVLGRAEYVRVRGKLENRIKKRIKILPVYGDEATAKRSASTIGRSYRWFTKFREEAGDQSEGEDEIS